MFFKAIALGAALSLSSHAAVAQRVQIDEVLVAKPSPQAQKAVAAATRFYEFWNSGDTGLLEGTLSPAFTDRTLPDGRPQGPEGPAFASKSFRSAVPDLSVQVRKMIVAGDYVTVHMQFRGHFTGSMGSVQGTGQPIDFIATDLLKVTNGLITDNWHIEDNLTLLTKMGVAKVLP
jgi:predicted ester cyclase